MKLKLCVADQQSALSLVGSKVLVCTLPCLFLCPHPQKNLPIKFFYKKALRMQHLLQKFVVFFAQKIIGKIELSTNILYNYFVQNFVLPLTDISMQNLQACMQLYCDF